MSIYEPTRAIVDAIDRIFVNDDDARFSIAQTVVMCALIFLVLVIAGPVLLILSGLGWARGMRHWDFERDDLSDGLKKDIVDRNGRRGLIEIALGAGWIALFVLAVVYAATEATTGGGRTFVVCGAWITAGVVAMVTLDQLDEKDADLRDAIRCETREFENFDDIDE